jgi:hypothetical protein
VHSHKRRMIVGLGSIGLVGALRQQDQIADLVTIGRKLMQLLELFPVFFKLVRPDVLDFKRLRPGGDKLGRKVRGLPCLLVDKSRDPRQEEFYKGSIHPVKSELVNSVPRLLHLV